MLRHLGLISAVLCIAIRAGAQTPPFLHAGDQSLLHFNNGNYSFTYHVMMTGNDYNPNDLLFHQDSIVAFTLAGQLLNASGNIFQNSGNMRIPGAGGTGSAKGYISYLLPLFGQEGLFVTTMNKLNSFSLSLLVSKFDWQNNIVTHTNLEVEDSLVLRHNMGSITSHSFPMWKSQISPNYFGIIPDTAINFNIPSLFSVRYSFFTIDMNGNYQKLGGKWSPWHRPVMKHHLRLSTISGIMFKSFDNTLNFNGGNPYLINPPRAYIFIDHIDALDTVWNDIIRIRIPTDFSNHVSTGGPYYYPFKLFSDISDLLSSPSGQYLYVILEKHNAERRLVRYDLSLGDTNQIYHQMETLYHFPPSNMLNGWRPTALQFGPNHEILVAMDRVGTQINSYLGLIPYPDSTVHGFNPFFLSKGNSGFGYFSNYLIADTRKPEFSLTHWCQDSVSFRTRYPQMLDSVAWDFGDPASGSANFSTQLHPTHQYSSPGQYVVQWNAWQWGTPIYWTDTITVLPTPELHLPTDSFLCPNDSLLLNVSQGFPATYLWSTGSTDSSLYVSQPGTYWVTVTTDSCGSASDTIVLSTYTPPAISLQDTVACEEDIIVFSVLADRASYRWNTGDTTSSIYAEAQGIYSVTATNPCGESTAEARLERQPCDCKLYIPDAFTPNADGNNDVFTLVSNCNDMQWELVIYNRWGQQVALLNEQQPQWNGLISGQTAPDGLYSYTLRYHFPESQPIGHSFRKVHYGQVLLLR